MHLIRRFRASLIAALLVPGAVVSAQAQQAVPAGPDPAVLARIRDAALGSDFAWRSLAHIADKIGPRLPGSPAAEAAAVYVGKTMSAVGLQVTQQPVQVPHWQRGEERAELVDYPDRPAGLTQRVVLTALGGSGATPAAGITAPVLVLHGLDELEARKAEVPGRIVLISQAFDQHLADNGQAGPAYGQAGEPRFRGPAAAARLGAAAVLVRSVGGADYRLPHTGTTNWPEGVQPIPAAALASEDVMRIERLAAEGPVTMQLLLTPRQGPGTLNHNVIADLPGRDRPEEVVLVSGHLDSWDLGTGAMDDGMGVAAAMGAVQVLQSLGLTPRRTVRFVAWASEENGGLGGRAYAQALKDSLPRHVAAIESDFGLGHPLGIAGNLDDAGLQRLAPIARMLRALGAGVLETRKGELGTDIAPLRAAGVPNLAPMVDVRHYFDYHHTAADTLDKVDPQALRKQVALLAVLAYALAEMPEPLARVPAAR